MSFKKNLSYRDTPFSSETSRENFTLCDIVRNLHAKCKSHKDKIIKIRTVGIFESKHGCFFIKEMPTTSNESLSAASQSMQVSMAYIHKSVQTLRMPYPVQIFGKMQWKGKPVIFAQIVQPLKVAVAIMLQETLLRILTTHCHRQIEFNEVDQYVDKNL